jgi:hypothetical protein
MFLGYFVLHHQDIIRRMLLLTLDDPHRKICTAIGMAVASIAAYDWPELWSDLLPFLLNLINNQANLNGGKHFILTWWFMGFYTFETMVDCGKALGESWVPFAYGVYILYII